MDLMSGETSKQTNIAEESVVEEEDSSSSSDEAIVEGETLCMEKEYLHVLLKEKEEGCTDPSLFTDVMTPSRCRKYSWIYFSNEDDKNLGAQKTGKWMLFLDRSERNELTGLTALDDAWQKLMHIDDFENSGVMSAKCSTAFPDGCAGPRTGTGPLQGVICCCTPDYTNKAQVKKAAEAVRKLVEFPRHMFFKTDEATYRKLYAWKGDRNVSLYKHTTNNRMYEKNSDDGQWYPVYFQEENVRRNSNMGAIVAKLADLLKEPRY